jgi:hypothetical protein
MTARLKVDANRIPDAVDRERKLWDIDRSIYGSGKIQGRDELLDFCIRCISILKYSIDGVCYTNRGTLIDLALEGLGNDNGIDLYGPNTSILLLRARRT